MAYSRKTSFAAGELDPALYERTNLEKYQSALATARNVYVGKTGRVVGRQGTQFVERPKYDDKQCIILSPPYDSILIEWGHQYVRTHYITFDNNIPLFSFYTEDSHDWTEFDLENIHYEFSGRYCYLWCKGKIMKKMVVGILDPFDPLLDARFLSNSEMFYLPPAKTVAGVAGTGTGYDVDYVLTYVLNGEESLVSGVINVYKMVIATGNSNTVRLIYTPSPATVPLPSEIKVYRRPRAGNAYGYIGSSVTSSVVSGDIVYDFIDLGGAADYTQSPPTLDFDALNGKGRTGTIYQQRLITTEEKNEEAIHASRPGYPNNFSRDYPLDDDSALTFKAGTSGNAKVLRFINNNGLIAFTTAGIFTNEPGALGPSNLAMDRKGNWVIDQRVRPLEVPGGILFVDQSTNTIRSLIYSNEAGGYPGEELSIFSNHLFLNKKIVSWSFQDGDIPLIWVCFDDGTLASLTYQREHQMQAWTRHDSAMDAKFECCTTVKDIYSKSATYFVVKRGNIRTIEYLPPRFVNNFKEYYGVDSGCQWNFTLNSMAGGARFDLVPQDPLDWAGELMLYSSKVAFTNTAGNGAIGTTWRFFDKQETSVDLVVTEYISATQVKVQPSVEFPFDEASNVTLQMLATKLGVDPGYCYGKLAHLEGQLVSVLVDGYVESSPNNNIENYAEVRVVDGAVTLPNELKGAFIRIGLPLTSDVETLDIDTIEQKPMLLESKIVNRVYVKVYRTRGIYVGSTFPVNDVLTDESDANIVMEDPEHRNEVIDLGNSAQQPVTKRYEIAIPNDWDSNGRIAIRQVDPLPFEILSIIPDITLP